MENRYQILIVGGGPGGYAAALYAARAGLSCLVLEKFSPGGQMVLTGQIDNYPGFPDGVDGFSLAEQMRAGAERFGVKTKLAEVLSMDLNGSEKRVVTDSGEFLAPVVILATGASPRQLGIAGEEMLAGRGVSYCAHCDGMFHRGKTVVVVGGGNSAVEDALYLARICEKVILVHRRDTLRATRIYHEQLQNTPNVQILWNSAVTQLHHSAKLDAVTVTDLISGQQHQIPCSGLFVSIGRNPATELVAQQLELAPGGYIPADETCRTAIPGVFAVGDVRTKQLRQVVTAVADGATAAHFAQEYLDFAR
jgi:thioredoxin reductase (NADPH)